jgi:3-deoxy-D-arabino-heptulosonate 7-phosphate (DAHP) synthase
MRVNIYAEEMTDRVKVSKEERNGQVFTTLRFYLELPATVDGKQYRGPFMHGPEDDDSSAVTFWSTSDLRPMLRNALELLDRHYDIRS